MILIVHVMIALLSLLSTTFACLLPSRIKLRLSYLLVVLTFAAGGYLVWSSHAPLTQACETGLVYLGIAMAGLMVARHRLASSTAV